MLGRCLEAVRDLPAAGDCFARAVALDPGHAAAHLALARVSLKAGERHRALGHALRATDLAPDDAAGWSLLGRVFGKLEQYPLSRRAYARALALDPEYPFLKGRLLQQQVLACDWIDLDARIAEIATDLAADKPSARPFVWQAVCPSPASLQRCAELFARPTAPAAPVPAAPRSDRRIRIGYLSGELRDHSITYLRVGMFEQHDRQRFEVVAFDNGWDDGGTARGRVNAAIDRIVPIHDLGTEAAAATIAREAVDVLVDLNGYNGLNRQDVLALRPAPIQATFPGYPGTLGADYMDYIIADAVVIPPEHHRFYRERPVLLPDSYQANDSEKAIAERAFTRPELGLPPDGFVFCCFNHNYKVMPAVFDVWARLLHAVPGSVLWLLSGNAHAVANLRAAAARRDLDPARLVFAPRLPLAEHLARHRAAGLFLDTLPCNAHTTASDALWAGLPVLTCIGQTFSGRVAASLLRAIGLPEMVTTTLADYERAAIRLATDPAALGAISTRLAANRLTMPLFDTARHTRSIERAYTMMHERRLAGLPPAAITVPAL